MIIRKWKRSLSAVQHFHHNYLCSRNDGQKCCIHFSFELVNFIQLDKNCTNKFPHGQLQTSFFSHSMNILNVYSVRKQSIFSSKFFSKFKTCGYAIFATAGRIVSTISSTYKQILKGGVEDKNLVKKQAVWVYYE